MLQIRLLKIWIVLFISITPLFNGCNVCCRNVIITGYWPPSNQMLTDFSQDKELNPTGWQGNNWKGLGYHVYAFFPLFSGGTESNPKGEGDFEVDYQDTLMDFQRITGEYKPIAIICYGIGKGPWEIEEDAVVHSRWHDDYVPPTQPDINWLKEVLKDGAGHSTLPTEAIAEAVNNADIGVHAWVDKEGDAGDFLCDYITCLATAYQQSHNEPMQKDYCAAAGFIHLGPMLTLEQAKQAQEITLETILKSLENSQ